jgi:hypothetical protein
MARKAGHATWPQPFVAPATKPDTMYRSKMDPRIREGRIDMTVNTARFQYWGPR